MIWDFLVSFINFLIESLAFIVKTVVNILPRSPFRFLDNASSVSDFISSLNWIIPFDSFVSIGSAWLSAIAAYYLVSVALRWLKAIR